MRAWRRGSGRWASTEPANYELTDNRLLSRCKSESAACNLLRVRVNIEVKDVKVRP